MKKSLETAGSRLNPSLIAYNIRYRVGTEDVEQKMEEMLDDGMTPQEIARQFDFRLSGALDLEDLAYYVRKNFFRRTDAIRDLLKLPDEIEIDIPSNKYGENLQYAADKVGYPLLSAYFRASVPLEEIKNRIDHLHDYLAEYMDAFTELEDLEIIRVVLEQQDRMKHSKVLLNFD